MKRVAIVVEGDTEEEFVKQVLSPQLASHGVVAAAMKPSGRGGDISVDRLAPVNDDRITAPSKRIALAVPSFRKRLHGPAIAREISLETIRAACPRFDAWVSRLESL